MKTMVQKGWTLTLTAPYTVTSGQGLKVGLAFGVANTDAASGASVEADVEGVFTLPKTSADVATVGAAAFWNDTTRAVTTTATGNLRIGYFTTAAGNGVTSVNVRLCPTAQLAA